MFKRRMDTKNLSCAKICDRTKDSKARRASNLSRLPEDVDIDFLDRIRASNKDRGC
jgi:hypothetical protein